MVVFVQWWSEGGFVGSERAVGGVKLFKERPRPIGGMAGFLNATAITQSDASRQGFWDSVSKTSDSLWRSDWVWKTRAVSGLSHAWVRQVRSLNLAPPAAEYPCSNSGKLATSPLNRRSNHRTGLVLGDDTSNKRQHAVLIAAIT